MLDSKSCKAGCRRSTFVVFSKDNAPYLLRYISLLHCAKYISGLSTSQSPYQLFTDTALKRQSSCQMLGYIYIGNTALYKSHNISTLENMHNTINIYKDSNSALLVNTRKCKYTSFWREYLRRLLKTVKI